MTENADTDPMNTEPLPGWAPPRIDLASVKTGDMPGDKVQINQSHVDKANTIFPYVLQKLDKLDDMRLVVSVYGGSGVGKSEIASLLGEYCRKQDFAAYVLSGDNYPHRIPQHNDLERLSVYRRAAMSAFARDPGFTNEQMMSLHLQLADMEDMKGAVHSDDDTTSMSVYHAAGRQALAQYLGTEQESDFSMVNSIIKSFKEGRDTINLKRMGRTTEDVRYDAVDFSHVRVLIIEWTHGNNPLLEGVDFPIFLFSTPAETLDHRLARGRDKNADSPLISLVLEIEQEKLVAQADRAALIISKSGEILSHAEFRQRAGEQ
jgi:alpha-galactosidase